MRTGWFSGGDYSKDKRIEDILFSAQSSGVITIYTYADFSSVPVDTFTTSKTDNYTDMPSFDHKAKGEYLAIEFNAQSGQRVVLRDIKARYTWLSRQSD